MKRKTFSILKHIPIIRVLVKSITNLPNFYSNYTRSDPKFYNEIIRPFEEYLKKNPDIQPTKTLFRAFILSRGKNSK